MNVSKRLNEIKKTAKSIRDSGGAKDPDFYLAKQVMRIMTDDAPLVEIGPLQTTVIDHDLSVHKF